MSFTIFSSLCVQLPSIVWLITRRHYEQWWISPKENPFIVSVFLFMQWTSFKSLRRKPTICSLIIIHWRVWRIVLTLYLPSFWIRWPLKYHVTFGWGIPVNSQANREVLVLGYLWLNGFFKITGFAVMDKNESQDIMKMEKERSTTENSVTNKLNILLLL